MGFNQSLWYNLILLVFHTSRPSQCHHQRMLYMLQFWSCIIVFVTLLLIISHHVVIPSVLIECRDDFLPRWLDLISKAVFRLGRYGCCHFVQVVGIAHSWKENFTCQYVVRFPSIVGWIAIRCHKDEKMCDTCWVSFIKFAWLIPSPLYSIVR